MNSVRLKLGVMILESLLNKAIFNKLLFIPEVRDYLVKIRFNHFSRLPPPRETRVISNSSTSMITYAHNFSPERMFFKDLSKRPDLIAKPLACEVSVMQNASKMRVLLIGSRTEAEVFAFYLCGFLPKNVFAIDIFSYTPLIKEMDACNLQYAAEFFDVIVCGWVLEFVKDVNAIRSEIMRCIKQDGILCIGAMYHPKSQDSQLYNKSKLHDDRVWMPRNTQEIINFFSLKNVIFNSNIVLQDEDKRCDMVVIGRVSK